MAATYHTIMVIICLEFLLGTLQSHLQNIVLHNCPHPLTICPLINSPIQLSIHPLSNHPSFQLSFSIYLSTIHPPSYPLTIHSPIIHLTTCHASHPSTLYPDIHQPIHLSNHSSLILLIQSPSTIIHLTIHNSNHPPIFHPSIHPPTICWSIYPSGWPASLYK